MTEDVAYQTFKNSGNLYFEQRNYDKAIENYSLAIQMIESNLNKELSVLARLLSNRSAAYLAIGNPSLALVDAERCARIDSSWPKAYYRIGMALRSLQQYQSSQEAFQTGLNLLEENSKSRNEFIKNIESLTELLNTQLENHKETYDGFLDMLTTEGCLFNSISIRSLNSAHRGVFATSNLETDCNIMQIPLHLLITVEMGMNCPFGKQVFSSMESPKLSSPKHTSLVLYIVWDRSLNLESKFQSYYSMLPKSFPTCPIFWSDEDLYLLLGSHLLLLVEERKATISKDYSEIIKLCPEFSSNCSLSEFTLLRMIVASRNFSIEINGVKTDALVPMADMMNHRRPRDTVWYYDDSQGSFIVQSLRNIGVGEEVFDSYGKKCNSRYLLNYGFTVLNNRDDDGTCYNQCCVEIGLDPADPSFSSKMKRLSGFSESSDTFHRMVRLTLHLDDPETIDAFCCGRFICASSTEIEFLPNPFSSSVGFSFSGQSIIVPPLSLQTELKVLHLFKKTLEEQLSYYVTTIEEDKISRSNFTAYSNEWNACNVLIGEKEICYFYLHLYNLCTEFMTASISFAIDILKERKKLENQDMVEIGITEYLEQICLPLMIRNEQINS